MNFEQLLQLEFGVFRDQDTREILEQAALPEEKCALAPFKWLEMVRVLWDSAAFGRRQAAHRQALMKVNLCAKKHFITAVTRKFKSATTEGAFPQSLYFDLDALCYWPRQESTLHCFRPTSFSFVRPRLRLEFSEAGTSRKLAMWATGIYYEDKGSGCIWDCGLDIASLTEFTDYASIFERFFKDKAAETQQRVDILMSVELMFCLPRELIVMIVGYMIPAPPPRVRKAPSDAEEGRVTKRICASLSVPSQ